MKTYMYTEIKVGWDPWQRHFNVTWKGYEL